MKTGSNNIGQKLLDFIKEYTVMNIDGIFIHCPYWINRLKDGKVILRGFANGKGKSDEIKKELLKRLRKLSADYKFELTPESLRKFARRERIGIDCSGLVYRVLEELLRLGFGDTGHKNLDKVFNGGINKTNVKRLTSREYSTEINDLKDVRMGDMIRLWGGKHAAIIIKNDEKEILYVHSSWLSTKIRGVHTSVIKIIDANKPLTDQMWIEKARNGENFGKKYFSPDEGNGIFRLKIFS